jgi:PAS domain S-box-containing protein
MKNIHITTVIGSLLNAAAVVVLFLHFDLIAGILALSGYFCAMKEVSKYTSWFQFTNVWLAAILVGLTIDDGTQIPVYAAILFIASFGAIFRIVNFRVFGYTGQPWFEPTFLILSTVAVYAVAPVFHYNWQAYAFPAPILLFSGILTKGILSDRKQLLSHTKGGYKVQIGNEAAEFSLPDQHGNIVNLSDYKDKRHLLVIFVRGDWCPGCHMMLRTYEKNREKFQSKNIMLLAIGPDPMDVNKEMMSKLGLEFKVLADEGQRVAMEYGVQLKEYEHILEDTYDEGIPLPASFLIDINGIVRYVSRPDKVGEFLNPSMIFPIIEQIDSMMKYQRVHIDKNEEKDLTLSGYEHIINQANDAILVIDIVDGIIHQANPSAAKLLEYPIEELKKQTLFNLHPAEYLQQSSSIVADVWEKGGMIYSDIPFLTRTGKLIPVECSAKVAPFDGRPAIVIYARDISERIRMENEIAEQRSIIDERNKDIQDSIEYSKRIQESILMEKQSLKKYAPDSFILFKPKDVVSGDFYWFNQIVANTNKQESEQKGHKLNSEVLIVAAVDCTGHGVPGAFMSIIGNYLLNQTLNNLNISCASEALDYVNAGLKKSLNNNQNETPLKDGMDLALCSIDFKEMYAEFSGANNPIYLVRKGMLTQINADKQPITASTDIQPKPFTNVGITLEKNDILYLFTDGFADQFGGEHLPEGKPGGKKYLYKRFKELLVSVSHLPMDKQQETIEQAFESWKGPLEQVDDVLVIGIKI